MEKLSADKIISLLSADAMRYFFPGYSAMESIYHEIRFRIHDSGKVAHRAEKTHDYLSKDKKVSPSEDKQASPAKCRKRYSHKFKLESSLLFETEEFPDDEFFPAAPAAESEFDLDPKTKALLDEIEAIKVKYGITIEELEAVLSYRVKLSHLRITRHKEIILDDFDHREVKMDALTKSIFLLYLKHPEGIRYKELCDHRSELEEIYLSISGRSDMDSIRKSIDDLTDPITSNSINEKVSRAKKAFREVVDVRIARFYYIDGRQGAAKRIALDRSLVIWE
ncbi:MAG: hypothetical protein PUF43_06565 [Bacteroidales bacterium]|nr:hypothetical protein [Bacteroidales bacterium]